jgi:hypothetical protein
MNMKAGKVSGCDLSAKRKKLGVEESEG